MRFGLAIAIAAVPAAAEAHPACRDASTTVGLSRCVRAGAWSHGVSFDLEGALVLQSFALHVDAERSTVRAAGGAMRTQLALGRRVYVGTELVLAGFTEPAPLAEGPLVTTGASAPSVATGFAATESVVVGVHAIAGPISYGGELAPGLTFAVLDRTTAAIPQVGARVRAELWLSPHVTLGATAGIDVFDPRDVLLAVGFGIHAMPWDRLR